MPDCASFLPQVNKPARYINREINAIYKKDSQVKLRFALIFPDAYEIGMSHLGLHILYHILNFRKDIAAERAYAPWPDMEKLLRAHKRPLCSLESQRPLKEFDILGFTLPYEMCYTNVLNILDLAGLPLKAGERSKDFPLVIGGGSAVHNPEPLADFFDFFLLGDGEEAILEIADLYSKWKDSRTDKTSLLNSLSDIEGGYVPSLFRPEYKESGQISAITPLYTGYNQVKRRIAADLDQAAYPTAPIVPYTGIVHDRINIEIARGCAQGCRFCQAGMTYRPVRERSPKRIAKLIEDTLANTGYDEVSFSSLSSGDYSCWGGLLDIMKKYESQKISISLPSLRAGTLSSEIIQQIKKVRKTGFTMAPEAGTDRLRAVLNKGITHQDIMDTAAKVFKAGWSTLKLYFMIGLPTETKDDLQGIVDIVNEINQLAKKVCGRYPKKINIGISHFVPKPNTPFQWCAQESLESFAAKKDWLIKRLKRRNFHFKWQHPLVSSIEGLLARGNRRMGQVILSAWRKGAKFDSWLDQFNYSYWQDALADCGIDAQNYAARKHCSDEIFPWEHLYCRLDRDFLFTEYQKAQKAELTPNCMQDKCIKCGVCTDGIKPQIKNDTATVSVINEDSVGINKNNSPANRFRLRAKFSKTGRLRFLSHLDVNRTIIRAINRAGIPINYSKGFNPHPKISFAGALAVGTASIAEYFDLEISIPLEAECFKERLNKHLPAEMQILEAKNIPIGISSLAKTSHYFVYQISVPIETDGLKGTINQNEPKTFNEHKTYIKEFMALPQIIIEQNNKQIDLKPLIVRLKAIDLNEYGLSLELILNSQIKPQKIIQKLYQPGSFMQAGLKIKRAAIWNKDEKCGLL